MSKFTFQNEITHRKNAVIEELVYILYKNILETKNLNPNIIYLKIDMLTLLSPISSQ